MSIYDGLEDGVTQATRFFFETFRVEMRTGAQESAKARFKQNLQHLIEAHDAAVDIMEEVMKAPDPEDEGA